MSEHHAPAAIVRAVRLLCVYAGAKVLLMGLKITSQVMDGSWAQSSDKLKHDFPALEQLMMFHVLAVFSVSIGFYVFVIWKIRRGRNWARYLITAVFVVTFVYNSVVRAIAVSTDGYSFSSPAVIWAILMAIHGYAIYLLFTKNSSEWFRSLVPQSQQA